MIIEVTVSIYNITMYIVTIEKRVGQQSSPPWFDPFCVLSIV